jgi:hypothetical protein
MADFSFISTMEVAHIGNLKQKLYVREPKWKTVHQSTGELNPDGNGFRKEKGSFLEGIEVEWWDNAGHHKDVFHSALLVPWEIAMQGQKSSDLWRYNHNIKVFKKIEVELKKS